MDRVWDEMWDKNSAVLIHESFSIAYKNFWKTSPPPFLLDFLPFCDRNLK